MKLLIVTQKVDVNDPILGFFHRWIIEFSKCAEKVTVICLHKGKYDLPSNVEILSLGKEEGKSKLRYMISFYKYIWQRKKDYEHVFVHMNPEYVVLGGILWKAWGKKVSMWYVHKQINLKLWIAEKFVAKVFTSSPQSFGIKSRKVKYVGHGIDTEKFSYFKWNTSSRVIVHVGRVTPIKGCETLIEVLGLLKNTDPNWRSIFIGETVTKQDLKYKENLKELIKDKNLEDSVDFAGSLAPLEISQIFSQSFASVNMTPAGGMDKVVLESWASGCPSFSSNESFREVYGQYADKFIFSFKDVQNLKGKIESLVELESAENIIKELSHKIRKDFNVEGLIVKIMNNLAE